MCGRYSLTLPPEAVRQWFSFSGQPNLPARYNIAPTQEVPIIRAGPTHPELLIARWGLVPWWSKEIGSKPVINARCEGVEERAAFREAFRERRCLVPADGFFEWQDNDGGPKVPYRICRPDRGLFAMAGIWEQWRDPKSGRRLASFAIMTTRANKVLEPIHDRMPVILDDADRGTWIAPNTDPARLHALLRPAPDGRLTAYTISARVNRVANDDAAIFEPAPAASPANRQLPLL
jgi:putative SOS response-associated peptidase YedK